MPIRNPLDCAISNFKTGHMKILPGITNNPKLTDVLQKILKELAWFIEWHSLYPEYFYYFFENDSINEILYYLDRFLGIKRDSNWIEDVISIWEIKKSYTYDKDLVALYRIYSKDMFKFYPAIRDRLLDFVEN